MKMDPFQRDLVGWGVLGVIAVGLGYVAIKWVIPAIASAAAASAAKAAGAVTSGAANTVGSAIAGLSDNSLTNGSLVAPGSGFGGDAGYNYSGFGLLSTPAAATNLAIGGAPAALGEGIGGGLFSIFGSSSSAADATYYTVTFPDGSRHAIKSANVDSTGNFAYGGTNYRLGDDGSGNKLATPLTTIYGSGAG